jgi:glucose/arabinose dehydrogenase
LHNHILNHNGGCLRFGNDGYLYIGMGDGGFSNDPQNRAQNLTELLGKMLRIDVDNPQAPLAYGIPADNPYVNSTTNKKEIWSYGYEILGSGVSTVFLMICGLVMLDKMHGKK